MATYALRGRRAAGLGFAPGIPTLLELVRYTHASAVGSLSATVRPGDDRGEVEISFETRDDGLHGGRVYFAFVEVNSGLVRHEETVTLEHRLGVWEWHATRTLPLERPCRFVFEVLTEEQRP